MTLVELGHAYTPENTLLYAIGDVHGYLNLLKDMHQLITVDLTKHPVKHHKIIHIGDYIDRGPDSSGCLQYLSELNAENNNVICLMGNHEAKFADFLIEPLENAFKFLTYGGAECALSYGVEPPDLSVSDDEMYAFHKQLEAAVPKEHIDFINQLLLSYTAQDYMFVHAGVRHTNALDQQSFEDFTFIRTDFINCEQLYPKVIIHGHTPHHPVEIKPNRINVDTMAYSTGELTAVVLEENKYRFLAT
jgi:serine/threonine protein phosphatase 1